MSPSNLSVENLTPVLHNIPSIIPKPDTFFDVLGVQTKENYISRAYCYFLNSDEKQIADLFLNSLTKIISEKGEKEFLLDDCKCETEVLTKKGGRIDLLLSSDDDEQKIIIENKVYHFLANDLQDYWDSIEVKDKIGVVLTLFPQKIEESFAGRYINITHSEWLEEVKTTGFPVGLSPHLYTYLNDFILNLDKLMENQKLTPELKYFLGHAPEIVKAISLHDKFITFINTNVDAVGKELEYKTQHKKDYYSYVYKNNEDKVFYSILYHKLMEGVNEITIAIEFWTKEITSLAKEIDEKFTDVELQGNGIKRYTKNGGKAGSEWLHFLAKDYPITTDELENFGNFIANCIKNDFADIMEKVLRIAKELTSKPKV